MDDEARFTGWYEAHYRDVAAYMRRRVPERMVADATADVFLVLWRRLDEVPAHRPLPWLYGVARLTVANALRGGERADRLAQRLFQEPDTGVPDHATDVAARLTVARAFDRLDVQDQEVLALTLWEELPLREGAVAMGCSVAAFTMRLHRARKRLRAALTAEPPAGSSGGTSGGTSTGPSAGSSGGTFTGPSAGSDAGSSGGTSTAPSAGPVPADAGLTGDLTPEQGDRRW